jgi:hypothetical protein
MAFIASDLIFDLLDSFLAGLFIVYKVASVVEFCIFRLSLPQ